MVVTIVELAWERYRQSLRKYPICTKAITSSAIAAISDVLAQRLASLGSGRVLFQWKRTVAMALFGLVWSGPSNHFWQQWLESFVPKSKTSSKNLERVLKKVIVDQLVYGPVANLVFMVFVGMALEGKSRSEMSKKINNYFPAVQRRGWTVWPAAQLISHAYIPLELRVLWANCVAFGWSTYLILQGRPMKQSSCYLKSKA